MSLVISPKIVDILGLIRYRSENFMCEYRDTYKACEAKYLAFL